MSGVFLSYSRNDRALADAIIRGLRAVGVVVWWDEDMRSLDWHQELERQISDLATIVVLWTPASSSSDHVKDEARLGLESGKLINVIVGVPKPPFPYDRVNGLPLEDWSEREPHRGWTRLIETIEEKVVARGAAKPGELTGALARREESLRLKQQALARAQEALEEAQTREAETVDAALAAQATFDRAEEQHRRVMEMRATHLIMSAAQQEYEAARAAKEDADRAQRAAKAEIKGVAREVALALAALESPDAAAAPAGGKPAAGPPAAKAPAAEAAPPPPVEAAAPPAPAPEPAKPAKGRQAAAAPPAPEPEPAPPPPAATPAPEPAPAPGPVAAAPAPAPKPAPAAAAAVAAAPAAAAAAPSVAPAAAASPAPPHTGGSPILLILGGLVLVLLLGAAGAGYLYLSKHPKPPVAMPVATNANTKGAPGPASVKPAAGPVAVDPTAAAVTAAGALAGKWAPQGLSCDSPIVIAVTNGAVAMTLAGSTSTTKIGPSPTAGVINAATDDGGKYTYTLGPGGSLSMVDPTGQNTKMSKCPG